MLDCSKIAKLITIGFTAAKNPLDQVKYTGLGEYISMSDMIASGCFADCGQMRSFLYTGRSGEKITVHVKAFTNCTNLKIVELYSFENVIGNMFSLCPKALWIRGSLSNRAH